MQERLVRFQALCDEYEQEGRRSPADLTDRQRYLIGQMASYEPTVKKILRCLDPKLADLVREPEY